ncbi:MAG: VOC family protein [Sphingobium sp.]
MIGYVTVGTNDLGRAAQFYDGLLGAMGEERLIDTRDFIAWGKSWEEPMFAVSLPGEGNPASPGHGGLVAMVQASRAQVDKHYAKALSLGAEADGAPSLRGEEGDQGFYAGYFRDPDGNRLCLFFVGPSA